MESIYVSKIPPKTGSAFYNYKLYHSVVLMVIAAAISVGDFGGNSDGAVFRTSAIGKLIYTNQLNIPPARQLPGENSSPFPMFFVADEAFALTTKIMKPYPQEALDNPKRIFNIVFQGQEKCRVCLWNTVLQI